MYCLLKLPVKSNALPSISSSFYIRAFCLGFISLFCLFVSAASSADSTSTESPRSLINRMSDATRNLNYDGIFIYQRGGTTNALRLIHKAGKDGEIERLVSLTGSAREVIRNQQEVTCFFPDDQKVMVERSRPKELFATQLPRVMDKLLANYQFDIKGQDRVAGRDTWIVGIKPKDAFRYGYQFWVDQENGLLLKSELRNRTGLLLEQIMFTQLEILDEVADSLLQPSISGSGYTWHNNSAEDNKMSPADDGWQVTWMPGGFNKNNQERFWGVKGKNPVNHLIYSDGLGMVSIFIEKLDSSRSVSSGLSRMGGVNAYTKVANGYQITAVGEVPQATVQRMANSVSWEQ